ncbi:hypothetical protein [Paenarthrobacter nitroguajacolicus]|uniref:hypothetical protein n=1 Tax=Paenarthrobacter nitroguajacolicus TaxID=211146 RepID=UPI0034170FDF
MRIEVTSAGLALMAHQDKGHQGEYLEQFADPEGKLSKVDARSPLPETARQGFAQLKGLMDPDAWGIARRPAES